MPPPAPRPLYRMGSKVEQVAFALSLAEAVTVEFAVQPRTVITGALQQSFPQWYRQASTVQLTPLLVGSLMALILSYKLKIMARHVSAGNGCRVRNLVCPTRGRACKPVAR